MDTLNLWKEYDPEGSGHIYYKHFWRFTSQIAIIIGVTYEELLDYDNKYKLLDVF